MQQEQAKAADVAEDEDGYAERGVGAAISGRTKQRYAKSKRMG